MFWPCLFSLIITLTLALTGNEVSSYCDCNLTPSFCDYNCCCDTDCTSESISTECYNSKSNSYCPDSTFFARLGSSYINPQGCFYYNSTSTIVDEITLTNAQITTLINSQKTFDRLSVSFEDSQTSNSITRAGYQIGQQLQIGSSNTFSFVQSDGSCLTSASGTATTLQLKFGVNMKLSCSLSTSTLPLLFSSFSGQTLNKFRGDTSQNVTIPSFSDPLLTKVELQIVIGTYGSDQACYIERVVASTSTVTSTSRTLNINFVQPSELLQMGAPPSFFPQLPSDMFYPIYLLK